MLPLPRKCGSRDQESPFTLATSGDFYLATDRGPGGLG